MLSPSGRVDCFALWASYDVGTKKSLHASAGGLRRDLVKNEKRVLNASLTLERGKRRCKSLLIVRILLKR
jgi:hypothetical protein